MNYKKNLFVLPFILSAFVLVFAPRALAANEMMQKQEKGNNNSSSVSQERGSVGLGKTQMCTNLDNILNKLTSGLQTKLTTLEQNREQKRMRYENGKEERDTLLEQKRSEWMNQREEHYSNLTSQATTDTQKQAILEYKTAVENAVRIRQNAVDKATSSYRAGVASLITSKEKLNETSVNAYKNAIMLAVGSAKSSCESTGDVNSIRTTLKEAINNAKEDLKNSAVKAEASSELQKLKDTREAAIELALDTYKTSIEKARTDLRAALSL